MSSELAKKITELAKMTAWERAGITKKSLEAMSPKMQKAGIQAAALELLKIGDEIEEIGRDILISAGDEALKQGVTQTEAAEVLGVTRQSMMQKINSAKKDNAGPS